MVVQIGEICHIWAHTVYVNVLQGKLNDWHFFTILKSKSIISWTILLYLLYLLYLLCATYYRFIPSNRKKQTKKAKQKEGKQKIAQRYVLQCSFCTGAMEKIHTNIDRKVSHAPRHTHRPAKERTTIVILLGQIDPSKYFAICVHSRHLTTCDNYKWRSFN